MRGEKKLAALPPLPCPELAQRAPEGRKKWLRFRAQIEELGGERILGVTVYDGHDRPLRRWWQNGDQYGYQCFQVESYSYSGRKREPGRLYDYGADNDYGYRFWTQCEALYGLSWDERAVTDFCGGEAGENPGETLAAFHRDIRERRLKEKHERQRQAILEDFQGIEELGEEFKRWCIEGPLRKYRYLFYEYTGRKEQRAWCSHCGEAALYPDAREYERGRCLRCGTEAEFRSRKKLERSHGMLKREWTAKIEDRGNEILVRGVTAALSIEATAAGGVKRELILWESYRGFSNPATGEGRESYDKGTGCWAVEVDGFHREQQYYSMSVSWIAPTGLKQIRERLGLRAPLETLAEQGLRGRPGAIFRTAAEIPETEYLIKGRLYRLAEELLLDSRRIQARLQPGQTAAERLGVSAESLELLRRVNGGSGTLYGLRTLAMMDIRPKEDEVRDMAELGLGEEVLALMQVLESVSLRKALNYIRRQMKDARLESGDAAARLWRDYLTMADRAGLNTEDLQMLLPKRLRQAHDETRALCRVLDNRERDEGIAKTAERLAGLRWAWKGLEIRPATSQAELIREGEILSHCVGRSNYGQKMAMGTTAIFFIRRQKEPEKPFATLELGLKDGKVIQCYGEKDRYPGDRVKTFYTRWEEKIVQPGLKENMKEAKSA